jgi:NADH:ubiquinone oxidoreductase subunit B-like Fe-S oxidoreductase
VGSCGRDGGVFAGSYACAGGVSAVLPVDLHIGGCPPSPTALLKGLLALLDCGENGETRTAPKAQ